MQTYKLMADRDGVVRNVKRSNDNGSVTYIPFVEGNFDYEQYLKWVELGNTPEPADEGTE